MIILPLQNNKKNVVTLFTYYLKMTNTDKKICILLADTLYKKGVRKVVVSPGSRNTPLIVAFSRHPELEVYSVVDERSAAFIGLGMARAMAAPVAICCTSGTASLNYSPAVAEAFYSSVPLIVITADRPAELVERRAPQTIRQPGIYSGFIKDCVDIASEYDTDDLLCDTFANLSDILDDNFRDAPGPVHINVQLSAPLGHLTECDDYDLSGTETIKPGITTIEPSNYTGRTFIFVGTGANISNNLLEEAAWLPGVVVFAENYTMVQKTSDSIIENVDATITASHHHGNLPQPDRIIKVGNSLVSKKYYELYDDDAIYVNDDASFASLLPYRYEGTDDFKSVWLSLSRDALSFSYELMRSGEWSQFVAVGEILQCCVGCNVQVSNGMSIRYTQLFDTRALYSVGCNRGVSGIDGSVSTAVGYAVASERQTVLITGDMSFQYDIGALFTPFIPDNFTIIVMNNRGGGIFRHIDTTRDLPECEKFIAGPLNVPVEGLAKTFGFRYMKVSSVQSLRQALSEIGKCRLIIDVTTDSEIDNKVLNTYYKSL